MTASGRTPDQLVVVRVPCDASAGTNQTTHAGAVAAPARAAMHALALAGTKPLTLLGEVFKLWDIDELHFILTYMHFFKQSHV